MLLKIPVERPLADIEPFAYICDGCVFLVVQDKSHSKGFQIQGLGPPSSPSPSAGTGKTGPGSFPDQISFQLGKGAGDMEKELARRCRGVNGLGYILIRRFCHLF